MTIRTLVVPLLLLLSPLLHAADASHKDARNIVLVAHEADNIQGVAQSPTGPVEVSVDVRAGSLFSKRKGAYFESQQLIDRQALRQTIALDPKLAKVWATENALVSASALILIREMPYAGKVRCGTRLHEVDVAGRLTALHCTNRDQGMRCAAAADLYERALQGLNQCLGIP
ncbi:hypothetical protein C7S18_20845 [Ahniella affigens]|uniref:Uncharacterized protein n=1 Tax=Ahniella affigens TaxID=2021234 RepID=A0A2P1PXA2_9GAMM|nr:hypothetical protein [Ahniella affigens]AVP99467.1 hypothetical protein C7S18_20845 [Ahniella affigens]